jgi:hypothetical protein
MYLYNANTAEAIQDYQAYDHDVYFDLFLDPKNRKFALTLPQSVGEEVKLWDVNQLNVPIQNFDCAAANFTSSGDTVITVAEGGVMAYIDIATRQKRMELVDVDRPSENIPIRVPFTNFDDSLLLYDGVLWDAKAGTPVHRFDKFTVRVFEVHFFASIIRTSLQQSLTKWDFEMDNRIMDRNASALAEMK